MLKFKRKELTPICGFTFTDPDTLKEFKAKNYVSFEGLEYHVQNYRVQNNLPPIDNFRDVWEHYICSNYPTMTSNCCPVEGNIARNFKQYISGAKVFIKSLFQKESDKFVSEEIAEQRATKCIGCKYNLENRGHFYAQYYTDKIMSRSVGKRRTKRWDLLYTCAGCSCILNSKVWFSDNIVGKSLMREDIVKLEKAIDVHNQPIKCWQLEARKKLNEK